MPNGELELTALRLRPEVKSPVLYLLSHQVPQDMWRDGGDVFILPLPLWCFSKEL